MGIVHLRGKRPSKLGATKKKRREKTQQAGSYGKRREEKRKDPASWELREEKRREKTQQAGSYEEYRPHQMIEHKLIRLLHHDYRSPGFYFATIVVSNRECCLARIEEDKSILTACGERVKQSWLWLAERYPYVVLDEFIVMPNHFHGLLSIRDEGKIEDRLPFGRLLAAFKTRSTKHIREILPIGPRFWQKDFYEHVIRMENDLTETREYIRNNPLQWHLDHENPENTKRLDP
jgi:putative transposase